MWSEQFEDLVRTHLMLPDGQPLAPDGLLADLGLDSMKTVSLLMDLEQTFKVTFADEMLTTETFATPAALWTALSQLLVVDLELAGDATVDPSPEHHPSRDEIESALLGCREVRQAAVVVREHRRGDPRLVAYVVLNSGFMPHVPSLLVQIQATLLPPHLIPSTFSFVETLPLKANGEVNWNALPEPDFGNTPPVRPARTPQEKLFCELFAEVLGLPLVGIDDNFFDVGGDSLMATRLVRRLREETGLPVTAEILLAAPTVADLADHPRLHYAATHGRETDNHLDADPPAASPSSTAERLVGLWRHALRTEDITVDDDFFELGGNSIIAVRLVPLILHTFGIEPHISVIFDHPTPQQLADALEALGATQL